MIDDLKRIAEEMDASQRVPPVPFEAAREEWVSIQVWSNTITAWIEKWGPFVGESLTMAGIMSCFEQEGADKYGDAFRDWMTSYRKAMEKP
jgi:hypothetical protein